MKYSIATYTVLALLLFSCEEEKAPTQKAEKKKTNIVDQGSFDMGEANNGSSIPSYHEPKEVDNNEMDVPFLHTTRKKTVSVQAFYMDQSEISSNEYRQFDPPVDSVQ